MTDKDTRSLKVITALDEKDYVTGEQKRATLQCLINSALEEQDLLTRIACANAVLKEHGAVAANTCIAVKAL